MSAAYDDLDKMNIVDKLNEVGNNYSISTDGLATALQKSASALKTAGNDMDEAVALVTAGGNKDRLKFVETHFYRTHLIARIA